MFQRRLGLWLVGAFGSVGSTAALGLSASARGLSDGTGLVTTQPWFETLELDPFPNWVVGGHDIRRTNFLQTVRELHERSNIYTEKLITTCSSDLEKWSKNVRPGTVMESGSTIHSMVDLPEVQRVRHPKEAIEKIQGDLRAFQQTEKLDQLIVVNVASTEPIFELTEDHQSIHRLRSVLERTAIPVLPASSIYALAAIDLGLPYVNFTPSLGASVPALLELAEQKSVPIAGKDGKTGETLIKTVLAPMFAARNLKILSWIGHNILGARDGMVLNDPNNKASKVKTKDAVVGQILGYRPQTHVSIEYVESLDDWKTAWDHIHFEGFLGTKMTMQFTWQGCDAILASPLVLDLARLVALSQRRQEKGILTHLACFFKSPMNVEEHNFFKQFQHLMRYVEQG